MMLNVKRKKKMTFFALDSIVLIIHTIKLNTKRKSLEMVNLQFMLLKQIVI